MNTITGLFAHANDELSASTLNKYPQLQFILCASSGTDHIDLEYCQTHQIEVFTARGANAQAVAEHVLTLYLLLSRKTLAQLASLKKGEWRSAQALGTSLSNKVFGILGVGAVGEAVAKKLHCLEPSVIYGYDPYRAQKELAGLGIMKASLTQILESADFLSIHIPLTNQTQYFISEKELELMKRTSYLVNVSRGAVVKETDLIEALTKHSLAGAALDVFETEPHINPELLALPNLIATPHMAAFTQEAREAMALEPVTTFLATQRPLTNRQIPFGAST